MCLLNISIYQYDSGETYCQLLISGKMKLLTGRKGKIPENQIAVSRTAFMGTLMHFFSI